MRNHPATLPGVTAAEARGFVGIALAVLLVPCSLAGQGAQRGKCTLIWEPTSPDTRSVSIREGQDAYVTYVSGGMLWTCGTATMRADSAVKYDLARRVDMIGNVRYRDTIRTLESELLTYFEFDDRVIATDSVHLTRLGDGSTLTGPRVEFLRAVSGVDEETIATGRPHMVLYPEGDDPGPPFDVDADRALFAGEEEARAFGDVIITRPDLRAEADSATFRIPEGTGVLYGTPWVEAEDITLRGDTIRTGFEENVLRDVHALGRAHAQGQSFEVRSERIDVAVKDDEVDQVWAHGEGIAEAISGDQHLYGDSLRFIMFEGRLDTINAVGRAAAVQSSGPARFDADTPVATGLTDEDSIQVAEPAAEDTVRVPVPVAEDSIQVAEPAAEDTMRVPAPVTEDSIRPPPEPEEASVPEADPGADAEPAAARGEDGEALVGETPAGQAEADETPAGEATDSTATRQSTGSGARFTLRLPTDEGSNWVTGDTLYAIFERPSDTGAITSPDSAGGVPLSPDSVTPAPAGIDSVLAAPTEQDSTADPVLERLTVIGNARSLYAQVRDSTATARPSRNYMIGARIVIFFRDGEPERVEGTDAIGLYLEPLATSEGGEAEAGALRAAQGDTTGIRTSPDSTGAGIRGDSTSVPVREDTTRVTRPDSTGRAPTRRGEDDDRSPVQARGATSEPFAGHRTLPGPPRHARRSGRSRPVGSRARAVPTPSRIFP